MMDASSQRARGCSTPPATAITAPIASAALMNNMPMSVTCASV